MRLKGTFEDAAIHDRWESVYRGSPLQDRFNDQLMDRILTHLCPAPDELFLDAGCGIGDHSIRIAGRGYRCLGVDISESILKRARENVLRAGLESKISLVCGAIEDLSLADNQFDFVHCRGVLMHIPDWEKSLAHLCRVLKPGGKIVIMEANHTSLEAAIVYFVRRFRTSRSRLVKTSGGTEFWSEATGNPFVVRIANTDTLIRRLSEQKIGKIRRFAAEFWDINRFPAGFPRSGAIRFNQLWFFLHLPAFLSSGNAIIGEKTWA